MSLQGRLDRDGRQPLLLGSGTWLSTLPPNYSLRYVLLGFATRRRVDLLESIQMKVVLVIDAGRLALALVMLLQMMH